MIIDKNGRLFGKVNIIDLCVVVVIIAAAVFVGMRMSASETSFGTSGTEDYVIKFFTEETPEYVIASMNVGDSIEDEQKSIAMGTVTDFVVGEGYMYAPDDNGILVKSLKDGYNSCEITAELKAQPFVNGILVDGNKYSVGHTMVIRAGKAKIYLRISDIYKKGEETHIENTGMTGIMRNEPVSGAGNIGAKQ